MIEQYPAGVRLPAEWEHQECVWLSWPATPLDWPSKFQPIQWAFAEMAKRLGTAGGLVRIVVQGPAHEKRVRGLLERSGAAQAGGVFEFYHAPCNRSWVRDYLPFFVHAGGAVLPVGFRFNGWAKYPDHEQDAQVPSLLANQLNWSLVSPVEHGRTLVLEGGAVDCNGQGILLATDECLLDETTQVRNPGYSRRDYETMFNKYLGIEQVVWLGHGIAGDDTHGHVDDFCRFVSPDTVVLCQESNVTDINYTPLARNKELLQDTALQVVELPMPQPVVFDGMRLPASYANFTITNHAVVVPTFNDPADRIALGILSELFPDRVVCGVHGVDLVLGQGGVHCLTHEQAAAPEHVQKQG